MSFLNFPTTFHINQSLASGFIFWHAVFLKLKCIELMLESLFKRLKFIVFLLWDFVLGMVHVFIFVVFLDDWKIVDRKIDVDVSRVVFEVQGIVFAVKIFLSLWKFFNVFEFYHGNGQLWKFDVDFLRRRDFLLFHVLFDDFLHFFHPGMLRDSFKRQPFFGLELKDLLDKVLDTVR